MAASDTFYSRSGGSPPSSPRWVCDACGRPVRRNGSIVISYADIVDAETAYAEWSARGDVLRSLSELPDRAKWHVLHDSCGAACITSPYEIDVRRILTWQQVAGWCAHLLGKTWITSTDWDLLLYRAGAS